MHIEGLVEPAVPLVVTRGFTRTIYAIRLMVGSEMVVEDAPVVILTDFLGTPRDFGLPVTMMGGWRSGGTIEVGGRLHALYQSAPWETPPALIRHQLYAHELTRLELGSWA